MTHNVVTHLDVILSFVSRETTGPFSCSAFLDVPQSALLSYALSYILSFRTLVFREDDTQASVSSVSSLPVLASSEYRLTTMDYTFMYHPRSHPGSQSHSDVLHFNILANNGPCRLKWSYEIVKIFYNSVTLNHLFLVLCLC